MIVRARSPLRISFGGGGTDVPPYCDERGGAVLSATVDRYAYASLKPGGDRIEVRSLDYDTSFSAGVEEEFVYGDQLDLARAVIDHFRREYSLAGGLEVFLHNDAPPGSGLGSSSAIAVALIRALAAHLRVTLDDYATAELAHRIERVDAGIKGGKQDQYATTFGGFNYIEFEPSGTVVTPLRVHPDVIAELEYSLVFAYVGGTHFAHIIDEQVANYEKREAAPVAAMDRIKALASDMKRALLTGDLTGLGGMIHESWMAKRAMAEGISTPRIDAIYEAARGAGALGGKVSGAGGGGFMFFLADPDRRFAVQEAISASGGEPVSLSFVPEGVRTWTV